MIEMHGLTKAYRTADIETTALSNINLEVNNGEFIAIMGPSGSRTKTQAPPVSLKNGPFVSSVARSVVSPSTSRICKVWPRRMSGGASPRNRKSTSNCDACTSG